MADRTRTHKGKEYTVGPAHYAADELPWMPENELQELAEDIAAHGQREPIERYAGEIIDGRNRELACIIKDIDPLYLDREDEMTDDAIETFVVSKSVHRRHFTPSQRAMFAAGFATRRPGRPEKESGTGAGLSVPPQENKASQVEAAQKLDVSERSVRSAKRVKEKAPELVNAVKDGSLDVKTAAKVADLPKRSRKKVAEASDKKKAAKEEIAKAKAEPCPDADPGTVFVKEVETICRDTDQLVIRMKALKASKFSQSIHLDSAVSQVEAARKALWQGRPAHVCPYCQGEPDGCKPCHNTGRVKKTTFDSGTAAMGGNK